jgi:DNA-binding response OmpR family regulator
MIYFKYLKALYTKENSENLEINKPTKKGKILLIDDEWNRGWKDIINTAISKEGIVFDTFEYDFKDKSNFNLYMRIQEKIKEFNPDVVILDLRLSQNDHENDDIDNYTGIKILQKIHEINAGIQVITWIPAFISWIF